MIKEDQIFENNIIRIGGNAEDNDKIVAEAKQTDYWFHLANLPSCHVIISVDKNNPITKQMIKYCAYLVKENTKYKNFKEVVVNYTLIKNVKRTKEKGKVILIGKVEKISV